MRPRIEIEEDAMGLQTALGVDLMVEVLLDIREQLELIAQKLAEEDLK